MRTELLDPDKFASTEQWFARFRDGFQSVIDVAAEGRTKYWAARIWVVTAVAPNAVIDDDRRTPNQTKPIVAIGHTKELVDLRTIESFLSYLKSKDIGISTFEEVYRSCA